jgi:hypothetical protein
LAGKAHKLFNHQTAAEHLIGLKPEKKQERKINILEFGSSFSGLATTGSSRMRNVYTLERV